MKFISLGPLPPPLGGTTVLFKDFCDRIVELPIEHVVIDTNDRRTGSVFGRVKATFLTWKSFIIEVRNSEAISLHASSKRFVWYGALLRLISLFSGKPVIVRAFGGSLDLLYSNSNWLVRFLFWQTFRNTLVLLETNHLIGFFQARYPTAQIDWLPNCRSIVSTDIPKRERNGRFVFVGHVNKAKGVLLLVELLRSHPDKGIKIDIIGSVEKGFPRDVLHQTPGLNYLGEFSPEEASRRIGYYTALILPTSYLGEGYPGVILEAYLQGTPVISTRWRSIPEIVLDYQTGLLIQPGNLDQLFCALCEVSEDEELWQKMSLGAAHFVQKFDARYWHAEKWNEWLKIINTEGNDI